MLVHDCEFILFLSLDVMAATLGELTSIVHEPQEISLEFVEVLDASSLIVSAA